MKATITVNRTVTYSSIVEMTEEEFTRLDNMLESDNREQIRQAEKELNEKVDVNDWQDDRLDDLLDFSRFVPDPATGSTPRPEP